MKVSLAAVRLPHWQTIVISFVAAILLTLFPLPEFLRYAKPDWLALVVIYWVLHLPRNLGVFFGWFSGIMHDILSFSLLGLHALGKVLIAAVVSTNIENIKRFNMIEQMLMVVVLQSINIGIIAGANQLASDLPIQAVHWQGAITTALFWPLVSTVLSRIDPFKLP